MPSLNPPAAMRAVRRRRMPGFWLKVAGALAVVVLADRSMLETNGSPGAVIAAFCLASLAVLVAARPAVRRDPRARWALGTAAVLVLALLHDPGVGEFFGLWAALGMATLLPRASRFGDALIWTQRLILAGCQAVLWLPLRDLAMLMHPRLRRSWPNLPHLLIGAIVPLAGTIAFICLFAAANPVIENLLRPLLSIEMLETLSFPRFVFWIVVFCAIWGVLRPRLRIRQTYNIAGAVLLEAIRAFLLSRRSLLASLAVFNLLFALQNGLDLLFLTGGAALPDGMTFAEYAHRGAYPLIATALLAGGFALLALRPGMGAATRRLLLLWIGQNVLLVMFSAIRTLDYIAAYDLTELRLAALIWMALVAFGLGTIVLRITGGRSAAWLINVNGAAAGLVLIVCSFADLAGFVAQYDVRHAREITGQGQPLDRTHLFRDLGPAALPAIAWLVQQPIPADLRECGCRALLRGFDKVSERQEHWRRWTGRNARILAALGNSLPTICTTLPTEPPL